MDNSLKLRKIEFKYGRRYPSHSEWSTVTDLVEIAELYEDFEIQTSTAALFTIVRAFCINNEVALVASYEGIPLRLTPKMRMESGEWVKCPDFEIADQALETILDAGRD